MLVNPLESCHHWHYAVIEFGLQFLCVDVLNSCSAMDGIGAKRDLVCQKRFGGDATLHQGNTQQRYGDLLTGGC